MRCVIALPYTALHTPRHYVLAQYGWTGICCALALAHAIDTDHIQRDTIALNHASV